MAIIWNGDINKTNDVLEIGGQRELRWYGVTIGQVGFGVLVSVKKNTTLRAQGSSSGSTSLYHNEQKGGDVKA